MDANKRFIDYFNVFGEIPSCDSNGKNMYIRVDGIEYLIFDDDVTSEKEFYDILENSKKENKNLFIDKRRIVQHNKNRKGIIVD